MQHVELHGNPRPAARSCLRPVYRKGLLQTISIIMGHHIDYSLEDIYNLQAIQRFHIHGSYNLSIRATHLNYFNKISNLTSLHFCSTLNVMLTELAVLARSAPLLEDVALPINGWPPNNISVDVPPHHPLKILAVLKKTEDPYTTFHTSKHAMFEKSEVDISDLSSFIDIAQFLDRVFPHLQALVAEENHQVWDAIFRIAKVCQAARAGSKS